MGVELYWGKGDAFLLRTILWAIYAVLHTIYTFYHLLIVYIFGALGLHRTQQRCFFVQSFACVRAKSRWNT